MRKSLSALVVAAVLGASVPARAQSDAPAPLEDGCVNEIGVLCRGMQGGRLLSCLDENRDAALPGCRASMDAEHDRLDKQRDEREAAKQEERLRAQLGEELEARITAATGNVYIHTPAMPEGRFVKAEPGTPLSSGDIIRTGADGTADVVFEGSSLITLTPNTDFTVNSLAPAETEFHLGLGRLIAKLAKVLQGRQLRFVTPTAVAAVRGTELVVDQPADKPSVVGVLDEGHVAVSAASGGPEVLLAPNQETQVGKSGPPQPAKPLAALQNAKASIAGVRQRVLAAQKQWKPVASQERVAARLQLARRPALLSGKLPGVSPAQQARAYPDARARRADILRRVAGGAGGAPQQAQPPRTEPRPAPTERRDQERPRPEPRERSERGGGHRR